MDSTSDKINTGLIGTGLMAAGICQLLVQKGLPCTVVGRSDESLSRLRDNVERGAKLAVRRSLATKEDYEKGFKTLRLVQNLQEIENCDLIIEAVIEDFDVKVDILRRIAALENCSATVGTNTSSLSVSKLAEESGLGARFIGLHFMNPVPSSKMVELVTHESCSWEHTERGRELAESAGLEVVEVKDSPGFVVNRLLIPFIAEAARLLEAKTSPAREIDTAMRLACGHPIGPLALGDMIGLDVVLAELEQMEHELGSRFAAPEIIRRLVRAGKLGRKSGEGFCKYR